MAALIPQHLAQQRGFASTHWTAIRACAGDDRAASTAREELCRAYWYPIYAYIRRSGETTDAPEDLTQDFFAHILSRPWFIRADPSKGKFRSFLLASLDNFISGCRGRHAASKRGGGYEHIPYDLAGAGDRFEQGLYAQVSPAQIYEVEWASAIVVASLEQLENEYAAAERGHVYAHLRIFLTVPGDASLYAQSAAVLEISSANVKVGVHRLRKRYGEILRERVTLTVAAPEDVEEELCYLRAVLGAA